MAASAAAGRRGGLRTTALSAAARRRDASRSATPSASADVADAASVATPVGQTAILLKRQWEYVYDTIWRILRATETRARRWPDAVDAGITTLVRNYVAVYMAALVGRGVLTADPSDRLNVGTITNNEGFTTILVEIISFISEAIRIAAQYKWLDSVASPETKPADYVYGHEARQRLRDRLSGSNIPTLLDAAESAELARLQVAEKRRYRDVVRAAGKYKISTSWDNVVSQNPSELLAGIMGLVAPPSVQLEHASMRLVARTAVMPTALEEARTGRSIRRIERVSKRKIDDARNATEQYARWPMIMQLLQLYTLQSSLVSPAEHVDPMHVGFVEFEAVFNTISYMSHDIKSITRTWLFVRCRILLKALRTFDVAIGTAKTSIEADASAVVQTYYADRTSDALGLICHDVYTDLVFTGDPSALADFASAVTVFVRDAIADTAGARYNAASGGTGAAYAVDDVHRTDAYGIIAGLLDVMTQGDGHAIVRLLLASQTSLAGVGLLGIWACSLVSEPYNTAIRRRFALMTKLQDATAALDAAISQHAGSPDCDSHAALASIREHETLLRQSADASATHSASTAVLEVERAFRDVSRYIASVTLVSSTEFVLKHTYTAAAEMIEQHAADASAVPATIDLVCAAVALEVAAISASVGIGSPRLWKLALDSGRLALHSSALSQSSGASRPSPSPSSSGAPLTSDIMTANIVRELRTMQSTLGGNASTDTIQATLDSLAESRDVLQDCIDEYVDAPPGPRETEQALAHLHAAIHETDRAIDATRTAIDLTNDASIEPRRFPDAEACIDRAKEWLLYAVGVALHSPCGSHWARAPPPEPLATGPRHNRGGASDTSPRHNRGGASDTSDRSPPPPSPPPPPPPPHVPSPDARDRPRRSLRQSDRAPADAATLSLPAGPRTHDTPRIVDKVRRDELPTEDGTRHGLLDDAQQRQQTSLQAQQPSRRGATTTAPHSAVALTPSTERGPAVRDSARPDSRERMDWPLSGNGERVGEFARNRPVTLAEFARTNRFELINVPADGACQIYALMLGMWNATTNGEWGGARLQEADEAAEDKARQREVSAGVREEVIAYVAAKYEQRNDMPLVQLLSTVGDDASYARNKVRLTALQTAIVAINDGVEPDAATIDDAYETYRRQGTYTGPECAMAMAAKFKRRIYLFNPDRYGTRAEVVGYIPTLVDDEVVAVDPVIRPLHDGRMDPDPDAICVAFVNMVGDPNNYAGHYYWLCPHDAYHAD